MQERDAVRCQYPVKFAEVGVDHVIFGVHERVEAKREVDRRVVDHRQGPSVAHIELGMIDSGEPPLTRLNASGRQVHALVAITTVEQVRRPTAVSRRDLENRGRREKSPESRPQRRMPLGIDAAPGT
jgi:hypothetical protein